MTEMQIMYDMLQRFSESLKGTDFHIESELIVPDTNFRIDLCILTKENTPYAIIEININISGYEEKNRSRFDILRDKYLRIKQKVNSKFFFISDGKKFYHLENSPKALKELTYEQLISKILIKDNNERYQLFKVFKNTISRYEEPAIRCLNNYSMDELFDSDSQDFCFTKNAENKIINDLFKINNNKKITKVCRYTSLNTLFELISKQNFRMFGITGMNDSSEVNFIEKCIYGEYTYPLSSAINTKFITSCCDVEKQDQLTFFRLYGDDAKGVCLIFDVKDRPDFYLKKIQYLKDDDNRLSFLYDFIETVKKEMSRTFVIRSLHNWSHFIKKEDYQIEEEIRLLYAPEKKTEISGWVLAKPFNIVNPYMDFPLNSSFPLQLRKIILGPKCPELKINKFQLEAMLKDKKIEDVEVCFSSITSYR